MRSRDLLIGKAKECTNSIDEILQDLQTSFSQELKPFTDSKKQAEKISGIRVKTRQLFSEFDKDGIFEKNIIAIDENNMLRADEEEVLERYRRLLTLFIDHFPVPAAEPTVESTIHI